jgi:hypothetical protein
MKAMKWALLVALALFAGWFAVKEAIEPHWTVRLGALLDPGSPPLTADLGDGLSIRLYPDARPHIGKVARIQKGLVLALDGEELIEEGYGFGAPIVVHEGRSYLSQEAEIEQLPSGALVKRFRIDTEDTWTQLFRRKYRAVEPLGTVVFTYTVSAPGVVDVTADFTGLTVTPELVYLTNEQGATTFTHASEVRPVPGGQAQGGFADSEGARRELIDAPDTPDQWIPSTAEETCLESPARGIRFCVETAPGQPKFIGRERYFQRRWSGLFWLAWAGSDIELSEPAGTFGYRVRVERMP